jgi:hypothetical protein
MSERVDRDALIAAGELAMWFDGPKDKSPTLWEMSELCLDAILPLIADAIEACGARTRDSHELRGLISVAAAGRLVRSFGGEQ